MRPVAFPLSASINASKLVAVVWMATGSSCDICGEFVSLSRPYHDATPVTQERDPTMTFTR
jgi:hypothetical protein